MERIKGANPVTSGKALKRVEAARTCAYKGCDTRLSAYNTEQWCWQHSPTREYARKSRR